MDLTHYPHTVIKARGRTSGRRRCFARHALRQKLGKRTTRVENRESFTLWCGVYHQRTQTHSFSGSTSAGVHAAAPVCCERRALPGVCRRRSTAAIEPQKRTWCLRGPEADLLARCLSVFGGPKSAISAHLEPRSAPDSAHYGGGTVLSARRY